MDKYKGKFRIPSARWPVWDYGANAPYFVTICTQTRSHDFGAVVAGVVQLTSLGQVAQDCWEAIPKHFPFVKLGEWIVMPNHVHGIIIIDKPAPPPVETQNLASAETQNLASAETQNLASLPSSRPSLFVPQNTFGPQSKNLASIVRGYKIGVTKHARQHNIPFQWQPRYHDHVIRSAEDYERISNYIRTNPQNWNKDSLYTAP
jgi:putative transposase